MPNVGRSAGRAIPSLLAGGVDRADVYLGFAGDAGGHRAQKPPGDKVQPHGADDEQIRLDLRLKLDQGVDGVPTGVPPRSAPCATRLWTPTPGSLSNRQSVTPKSIGWRKVKSRPRIRDKVLCSTVGQHHSSRPT